MIRTYPKVYASDPYRWQQTLRDGDKDAGGTDRTVKFIGDQIVVEWADRLKAKLENDTSRVQSAQVIAKALNGNRMGKYHTIAERVAAFTQKQAAEGDKLMARMDELEKKAPVVLANAHSYLDQQNADLDVIDSGLRQLSNTLPLDGSHNV